jgi:hypothetical protein
MKGDYKPTHTRIIDMCKGTCMGSGAGPCWLLGPQTPWCDVAEQGQDERAEAPAVQRPPVPPHETRPPLVSRVR